MSRAGCPAREKAERSWPEVRTPIVAIAWSLLASFLSGCEGAGGTLLMTNPMFARWASASEEEAEKFPLDERYRWAYSRYEIEATDFRRGIRWRNALKVENASIRAVRHLKKMLEMMAREEDRKIALEAIEGYVSLGEALSFGRWFRSGMDAANALHRKVEDRLAPGGVSLFNRRKESSRKAAKDAKDG